MNDGELLEAYARSGSQEAFGELVQKHLGLVYSAARRQVGGDVHLAQDVAQEVFRDLSLKARSLTHRSSLAGWLYTSARFGAAKRIRTEVRRREREQAATAMQEMDAKPAPWERLGPVLDEAMHELPARDREVVLLHFFERQSHGAIASQLGVSDNSVRKRLHRALARLHRSLERRGIESTAAALAVSLAGEAVGAVPAQVSASIATVGFPVEAGSAASGTGLLALMKTAHLMGAAALGLLFATAGTALYLGQVLNHSTERLKFEQDTSAGLRDRLARLERTSARAPRTEPVRTRIDPATPEAAAWQKALKLLDSAEFQAKYARAYQLTLRAKYALFYRELGLTAAQIDAFESALAAARKGRIQREIIGAGDAGIVPEADPVHLAAELQSVLGASGYQQYLQFNRLQPSLGLVTDFANQSLLTGTAPPNAEQEQQLVRLLASCSPNVTSGGGGTLTSFDWQSAVIGAKAILSGPQFAAWAGAMARDQAADNVSEAIASATNAGAIRP